MKKCKRINCGKEFKPIQREQAYCSKDCAPYGKFKDEQKIPNKYKPIASKELKEK